MYTSPNFPSKAALKRAVAAGEIVTVFAPGIGYSLAADAEVSVEGPHYPKPHTWYARVAIRDGIVNRVIA